MSDEVSASTEREGRGAERPLVSALIHVHNGARFLPDSIGSVFAQDYAPIELIVIENGSTDGSLEVARRLAPDADVSGHPQLPLADGRNQALSRASGEWISFLDADDSWPVGRTSALIEATGAAPGVKLVFGDLETFRCPLQGPAEHRKLPEPELKRALLPSSSMVHRDVFAATGPFDRDYGLAEWGEWLMRVRSHHFVERRIDEMTLRRRLHTQSLTFCNPHDHRDYARAMLKGLRERREAAAEAESERRR